MTTINDLTAAAIAFAQARTAHEEPNGEIRFDLINTFRAPTPEEYAGEQIARYGSAQKALEAMQQMGRQVDENYMDGIGRQAAAIIAAAIARS